MAEDTESDIAIRFVDENDYRAISAKAVSAKRKLKKNRPFLSCIELTVQQGNWFDIYSFISLLLFNKNNIWRPTCFIVQTTGFNRLAKFLILLKQIGRAHV